MLPAIRQEVQADPMHCTLALHSSTPQPHAISRACCHNLPKACLRRHSTTCMAVAEDIWWTPSIHACRCGLTVISELAGLQTKEIHMHWQLQKMQQLQLHIAHVSASYHWHCLWWGSFGATLSLANALVGRVQEPARCDEPWRCVGQSPVAASFVLCTAVDTPTAACLLCRRPLHVGLLGCWAPCRRSPPAQGATVGPGPATWPL